MTLVLLPNQSLHLQLWLVLSLTLIIPLLGVLGINTYYHNVCVDKKCFHQPKDFSHCTLIPSQSKLDFLFLPLQGHQINQQNPDFILILSKFYPDKIKIKSFKIFSTLIGGIVKKSYLISFLTKRQNSSLSLKVFLFGQFDVVTKRSLI